MLHSSDIQSENLQGDHGFSASAQRIKCSSHAKDAGSCGEGPGVIKTVLALAAMIAITLGVIGVNVLIWGPPSIP